MEQSRNRVIALENDVAVRDGLIQSLRAAGYDAVTFATLAEGLDAARQSGADLLLLDAGACSPGAREAIASVRGSAATEGLRVILLVGATAAERAAALDIGADDAISRPWDSQELVSRVRAQLRVRRIENELREKSRIAQEGQQIAHTAFEALAVTEKMASDATSLDRRLKIGVGAAFGALVLMAGIYFLFARSAQHETKNMHAVMAQLNGSLVNQQNLMARVRQLRGESGAAGSAPTPPVVPLATDELRKRAHDLKAKMATADSTEVAALRKELAQTNARLKRIEDGDGSVETLIADSLKSVCLLHVAVAFNEKTSGERLRYAGVDKDGEPTRDSEGYPILTLQGQGPEVKVDVFGTGFLVTRDGLLVTNHHVAQPWWKSTDLGGLTLQGFQPEISSIRAYFPGDPRSFQGEIQDISQLTDLATIRVDMQGLKRTPLSIDSSSSAAIAGEPIVLMGYATGLAAILARADQSTVKQIIADSKGDVSHILDGLAQKDLIRPLITQGHIGDVSTEKIVFDAQTTSGGSGGPLFNDRGKVIGVTYAVLRGFGGSNFGIPIGLARPLLAH
jgi:DNA-binding response OmpR family regulator/S1-C subfamily serine protease